ncbi:MAG: thioredoxin family protein [Calditrichae bacterium]|nr:thioredoxin family protein [Calditrichota bacterium]MCB9057169.1 thioredoxin family protein [Calditrichia bacterium]
MIRLALISFLFVAGCSHSIQSAKVSKDNSEMLYGEISEEQLYFDYPNWKEMEVQYNPNPDVTAKISEFKGNLNVQVFLGTWCGDSRRNVPRFLKSIANTDNLHLQIWAVDRHKKLDNALTEKYQIKRVPTFIFLNDTVEIGRITEHPVKTIEEDILEILNRS